jgi:hypothetical protein
VQDIGARKVSHLEDNLQCVDVNLSAEQIKQLDQVSQVEADTSLIFPDFLIKEIVTQYVSRAWQVGSSVALREFSQTLL